MSQPDPKRWAALWFIALAQFMVIMDTSIIAAISALAVSKGAGHLDDPEAPNPPPQNRHRSSLLTSASRPPSRVGARRRSRDAWRS
jgi:hypothetical protein